MTLAAEAQTNQNGTERTRFYHFDGLRAPWAHMTRTSAGDTALHAPWPFYLHDPQTGYPETLHEGAGNGRPELRRDVWGRREKGDGESPTPFRFAGQYEDEETGLFYNRHRFYDPEIGRYLTPDPAGVENNLSAYAYAENQPTFLVDLDG